MTTTYSAEVLADNPVGYWRLDDTSGSAFVSEVGSGLSGSFFGSPTKGVAGNVYRDVPNLAMTHTGALANYLQGPSSPANDVLNPHLGSMTWEWVFRTTAASGVTFYAKHAGGSILGILTRMSIGVPIGRVQGVINNAIAVDSGAGLALNDGLIHHVAFVLDRSQSLFLCYVDGILRGTTSAASQASVDLTCIQGGEWGFLDAAGETHTWSRIAVYATALSPARIAAHAAAVMPKVARIVKEAIQAPTIASEVLRISSVSAEGIQTPSVVAEALRFSTVGSEAIGSPTIASETVTAG